MVSSVAPAVTYPILSVAALVILLRSVLVVQTLTSRRLTLALGFTLMSCILRQGEVQQIFDNATGGAVSAELVKQLSTVMLMFTAIPLMLAVVSWIPAIHDFASRYSTHVYLAAVASGAFMLAIGHRARFLRQYIEVTPGWPTLVFALIFSSWCALMAFSLLFVCVRELCLGRLPMRHNLTYAALLILGLWAAEEALSIGVTGVLASQGVGSSFVEYRIRLNENNAVFLLALGTLCVATPLGPILAGRLGIDRWSRAYRRLSPMWRDLTDACPEVRLDPVDGNDSALGMKQRTHRMVIEVRDALAVLNRFRPDGTDATDDKQRADMYRAAVQRKRAGAKPSSYGHVMVIPARDIREEFAALSRLAAHWPASKNRSVPRVTKCNADSGGGDDESR